MRLHSLINNSVFTSPGKVSLNCLNIKSIGLIALAIETFGIPYQTVVNGTHTGTISAVETSGIIFKTVTVYVKTDPQSSQEDAYCLIDKSLIETLKGYEQAKTKVTIRYNSYLIKGYINCDSEPGGIIIGVSE